METNDFLAPVKQPEGQRDEKNVSITETGYAVKIFRERTRLPRLEDIKHYVTGCLSEHYDELTCLKNRGADVSAIQEMIKEKEVRLKRSVVAGALEKLYPRESKKTDRTLDEFTDYIPYPVLCEIDLARQYYWFESFSLCIHNGHTILFGDGVDKERYKIASWEKMPEEAIPRMAVPFQKRKRRKTP